MNTIEGNKAIAEFMGYEYKPSGIPVDHKKTTGWIRNMKNIKSSIVNWDVICGNEMFVQKTMGNDTYPPVRYHLGSTHYDLRFDSNWSWLMPAYIRCQKVLKELLNSSNQPDLIKDTDFVRMRRFFWSCTTDSPITIKAVWESTVEFITWFNQYKNEQVANQKAS